MALSAPAASSRSTRRMSSSTRAVAGPSFRPPSMAMVSEKLPPCSRTRHLARDRPFSRALFISARELRQAVGGVVIARNAHLRDRPLDVGAFALALDEIVH